MIKKICLGVIRFAIGQSELDFLTALLLEALAAKKLGKTCPDLRVITRHNPGEPKNTLGCAGIVFSWI